MNIGSKRRGIAPMPGTTPEAREKIPRQNPWVAIVLLMLFNALMAMDRNLPMLMAEPIKIEFGLSDGQIGILIGLAFAVPLGVAGLLLGPLIDRVNRKKYLMGLVTIWSSLTLLTGMAWNYILLLGARAALGAAEASGQPAALSVIGDTFPPARRATAVSLFKIGSSLGVLFASGVVGYVAATYGWRYAFFAAAIPGYMVVLAMAILMSEPQRGAMDASASGREPVPYSAALVFVTRNPVVAPFVLGMTLFVFAGSAFSGFAAPFLQRNHDVGLGRIGLLYGIGSAMSMISPLLLGLAADRIMARGVRPLVLFVAILSAIITMSALAVVLVEVTLVAVTAFVFWQIVMHAMTTPCYAMLISVTPSGMRGTVLSLVTVATMCLGYGLGPIASGFASDHIGGPHSLRYALLVVVGIGGAASAWMFWLSSTRLPKDPADSEADQMPSAPSP
ncbi:MFS transporter [Sphingomonadaceae bacterium G21617-S1]|nr:MFS transporter [Sphingomonadaceae bacterium G21617-S1]